MIEAAPLVLADGSICYVTRWGSLMALNPDQSVKWYAFFGAYGYSSPTAGANGILYASLGSTAFGALAIHTVPGRTPWPKFRGNTRNTGNVIDVGR
jgi:hypothetical protein